MYWITAPKPGSLLTYKEPTEPGALRKAHELRGLGLTVKIVEYTTQKELSDRDLEDRIDARTAPKP